jgi:hypothetical protein
LKYFKQLDQSVLEMHHCSVSFDIVSQDKYNIFENFTSEKYQEFRKKSVELILSTDMSQHFAFISKFKSFSTNKKLSEFNNQEKLELMKLLLKSADVGNVTKPFVVARKWAKLCIREFLSQGDLEKKYHLPIGVLNDRENLNFPKSQLGFVEYIAGSLFIELVQLFPSLEIIVKQMEENKRIWTTLVKLNKLEIDSQYEIEEIFKQSGAKEVEKEMKPEVKPEAKPEIKPEVNQEKILDHPIVESHQQKGNSIVLYSILILIISFLFFYILKK